MLKLLTNEMIDLSCCNGNIKGPYPLGMTDIGSQLINMESVVESADSVLESADSSTDSNTDPAKVFV